MPAHCDVVGCRNKTSQTYNLPALVADLSARPSRGIFLIPRALIATRQKRAFSIVGPSVWNGIPTELRSLPRDLSSSVYKLLKTILFGQAWARSASE